MDWRIARATQKLLSRLELARRRWSHRPQTRGVVHECPVPVVDLVYRRGWLLVAELRLATALAWVVEGWLLAQMQASLLLLPLAQVLPLALPLVESALAVLSFG